MPGVDSLGTDEEFHFPAIGGNVYTYGDDGWVKHRTVPGGEHVHDVAWWNGAAWSVGSGADDRPEFEAGNIHRYLWRSLDQGRSWMTIHREPFPVIGSGDTRWVHLLPQDGALYLFGYEFNWVENQTRVVNARFDGWTLHPLETNEQLHDVFGVGTLPLTTETGLLWGVDVNEGALRNEAWLVESGKRRPLPFLQGRTLIDANFRADTGEVVILSRAGNEYGQSPETMELKIHLTTLNNPYEASELASWTATDNPTAIAFFDGSLFLGTSSGDISRAVGTPESSEDN